MSGLNCHVALLHSEPQDLYNYLLTHSDFDGDLCLLVDMTSCENLWSCRWLQTFRRNMLPSSLVLKDVLSFKLHNLPVTRVSTNPEKGPFFRVSHSSCYAGLKFPCVVLRQIESHRHPKTRSVYVDIILSPWRQRQHRYPKWRYSLVKTYDVTVKKLKTKCSRTPL